MRKFFSVSPRLPRAAACAAVVLALSVILSAVAPALASGFIASMHRQASANTGAQPVSPQDDTFTMQEQFCIQRGKLAGSYAKARDVGIPLSKLVHMARNNPLHDHETLKDVESMILQVYTKWYLTPITAQQEMELQCLRVLRDRQNVPQPSSALRPTSRAK
jgi:hypothetical protein